MVQPISMSIFDEDLDEYMVSPKALKRFVSKFSKSETCWLWQASVLPFGYGRFWLNGKGVMAHRVAYSLYVGVIPEDKFVLHKCDVPPCVNPDHLFLGTKSENTQDMLKKGRANRPHKLAPEQVLAIRQDNRPQRTIASDYSVHQTLIHYIKTNKIWVGL